MSHVYTKHIVVLVSIYICFSGSMLSINNIWLLRSELIYSVKYCFMRTVNAVTSNFPIMNRNYENVDILNNVRSRILICSPVGCSLKINERQAT
jgi:hypothetical protein